MWLLKKWQKAGGTWDYVHSLPLSSLLLRSVRAARGLCSPPLTVWHSLKHGLASCFQAGQERPVTFPSEQAVLENLRNSLRFQVTTIKQEKSS